MTGLRPRAPRAGGACAQPPPLSWETGVLSHPFDREEGEGQGSRVVGSGSAEGQGTPRAAYPEFTQAPQEPQRAAWPGSSQLLCPLFPGSRGPPQALRTEPHALRPSCGQELGHGTELQRGGGAGLGLRRLCPRRASRRGLVDAAPGLTSEWPAPEPVLPGPVWPWAGGGGGGCVCLASRGRPPSLCWDQLSPGPGGRSSQQPPRPRDAPQRGRAGFPDSPLHTPSQHLGLCTPTQPGSCPLLVPQLT